MTIVYEIDHNLYINVTNRCTNDCSFCIRQNTTGIGVDLWMEQEPDTSAIIAAIRKAGDYQEYVFCGYGEPLLRLPEVIATARYLKESGKKVRINTNGLAGLSYDYPVPPLLAGLVDSISISLNAADEQTYIELCKPNFGPGVYNAILEFTRDCLKYIPEVILSVVDVIPEAEIQKCAEIARNLGAKFRVRHYQDE